MSSDVDVGPITVVAGPITAEGSVGFGMRRVPGVGEVRGVDEDASGGC